MRVKNFRLILCSLFCIAFLNLFSQTQDTAYSPGEQISYGAYYNWHFVWIQAGEVLFRADTVHDDAHTFWQFKATGKTFKTYDFFYTVRDTFEAYVDYDKFTPIQFQRVLNHARKTSRHEYSFDRDQSKIYSFIKRNDDLSARSDTLSYQKNTFDLLSSAYFFRSYNFSEMRKGQTVKFNMLVDNKLEDLYFRYLGEEEVKTRGGERFQCHKVSIMLLEGDFFPGGEHMKVWFTNDQNKLPVIVETEVAVGSVKAILTDYKDLKYPLTSKIK